MHSRTTTLIGTVLCAMGALAGCDSNSSGAGRSTQAAVSATPQAAQSQNTTRLIASTAPLHYLLASGGPVRIMDTAESRALFKSDVPPQTIIRIDPKTGIHVNKSNPVRGPLPDGRTYEIWLDRR